MIGKNPFELGKRTLIWEWGLISIHSQFRTYSVPHNPIPLMFLGAELGKLNVQNWSKE